MRNESKNLDRRGLLCLWVLVWVCVICALSVYERLLADRILLHSVIGYWHHPVVRPSICLSVCLWRCGSRDWRQGWKKPRFFGKSF